MNPNSQPMPGRPSLRRAKSRTPIDRPASPVSLRPIDRNHLGRLISRELAQFERDHPQSRKLFERGRRSLLGGVPMSWMSCWAAGCPVFVDRAQGPRIYDADGRAYVDFCLGDTGSMFGHSPPAIVRAVTRQLRRGMATMLPTEDSVWIAKELSRRFGLPYWQLAMTASDANRFALRIARAVTGRSKILVFNGCYHGSVDEALVELDAGRTVAVDGSLGPPVDPSLTTRVVEFNDREALEQALAPRDVAAVLAEPAMTNQGIILPEPGYHEVLREATHRTGTLLVLDETHTLCEGPGGYTRAHHLHPDMLTVGKPIAGGLPAAAFGMNDEVAKVSLPETPEDPGGQSGIGGTLTGNPLAAAAMRAALEHVITPKAYRTMIPLARRWTAGVQQTIRDLGAPWHVTRLGARAEYRFRPTPPRNGGEARAARDPELDRFFHLYALNRGILLTPFHNMALMSPSTRVADIDRHTTVFAECAAELWG